MESTEQKCRTCKHWDTEGGPVALHRNCLRIPVVNSVIGHEDEPALTSYDEPLLTRPDFGCSLWESKDGAQAQGTTYAILRASKYHSAYNRGVAYRGSEQPYPDSQLYFVGVDDTGREWGYWLLDVPTLAALMELCKVADVVVSDDVPEGLKGVAVGVIEIYDDYRE